MSGKEKEQQCWPPLFRISLEGYAKGSRSQALALLVAWARSVTVVAVCLSLIELALRPGRRLRTAALGRILVRW
jgi:hypothetical protein